MNASIASPRRVLAAALGLALAGNAAAAITGTDTLLDGSFNQLGFGADGRMNVTPLLYVGDFGATDVAATQVLGSELSYAYAVSGFGTPVLDLLYTVTNDPGASAPFSDLRFLLNVRVRGEPGAGDIATAVGFGAPVQPGQPEQFQVFDAAALGPGSIERMRSANGLNGSVAGACGGAGCATDLGLQWNRASLAPGESWQIAVQLVDDPSLVAGGRYLSTLSAGAGAQALLVGNVALVPEPETYAMLGAGLGLLASWRLRGRAPRRRMPSAGRS